MHSSEGTEKTNISCRSSGRQGPIESEPEAHVSTKTTKT